MHCLRLFRDLTSFSPSPGNHISNALATSCKLARDVKSVVQLLVCGIISDLSIEQVAFNADWNSAMLSAVDISYRLVEDRLALSVDSFAWFW